MQVFLVLFPNTHVPRDSTAFEIKELNIGANNGKMQDFKGAAMLLCYKKYRESGGISGYLSIS